MGVPRRPWLEAEALKAQFLRLSAGIHPDHIHDSSVEAKREAQERFMDLNTAYNCLREPRERLGHLLELETGRQLDPLAEIPPGLSDLFFELGGVCRQVDEFNARRRAASSPLLQVRCLSEGQSWLERSSALQAKVRDCQGQVTRQLQATDAQWQEHQNAGEPQPASLISHLAEIHRLLGYLNRWSAQVQERMVQLSL